MKYIYENFVDELKQLNNADSILIIPLGRCVEEVLFKLSEYKIITKNQILTGFPHPSGANVNRIVQFDENRSKMVQAIKSLDS